jgi:hypothetical protein
VSTQEMTDNELISFIPELLREKPNFHFAYELLKKAKEKDKLRPHIKKCISAFYTMQWYSWYIELSYLYHLNVSKDEFIEMILVEEEQLETNYIYPEIYLDVIQDKKLQIKYLKMLLLIYIERANFVQANKVARMLGRHLREKELQEILNNEHNKSDLVITILRSETDYSKLIRKIIKEYYK